MKPAALILATLLVTCGTALADTVNMRNGTSRVGIVESHNDQEVHLRIDNNGITSVLIIPTSQVTRIVLGGPGGTLAKTPATQSTTTQPTQPQLTQSPATTQPLAKTTPLMPPTAVTPTPANPHPSVVKPPTDAEMATFASRGFLAEMATSSVGHGLDDPARLPAAHHELWDRASTADANGKRGETLDALRLLESVMRDLPEGQSRIDAISRRVRGEGFGTWMARVHWESISAKVTTGQFDLADVREVERPVLIGIMKGKTTAALEPLKNYFPPIDEKTGQPLPFKPAQLAAITLTNAAEVKDQASLAAALLLGQLKLEPEMSSLDRGFLSSQLATVNRILNRARDLEPQARAALAKAAQQQRAEAEKAQRDAAIAARKAAMTPH